jgi:hypothetical protein
MGPADVLDMLAGYQRREHNRKVERDNQNHLLRTIATITFNAHASKGRGKTMEEIFPIPSIDNASARMSRGQMKQKSDALFKRAKQNGNLS